MTILANLNCVKCPPAFLTTWTTPQQLTIVDWRLGMLAWFLRASVVVFVATSIAMNSEYQLVEEPNGFPTFWFSQAGLRKAQNGTAVYCNNSAYNHYTAGSTLGKHWWNDMDIGCARIEYGDILKQGPDYGHVTTYFKQQHTKKKQPCGPHHDGCSANSAFPGSSREVESDKVSDGKGDYTCICSHLQDYFVLGVEEIEMSLQHTFRLSSTFDYLSGSTTYPTSTHDRKSIKTCIRNLNLADECTGSQGISEDNFQMCCGKVFESGTTITYTVREWVAMAGLLLDRRVKGSVTADNTSGLKPYERLTGSKISVNLRYYGDIKHDEVICILSVSQDDGWTEFGSDVIYASYDPAGSAEYYDSYKRGLRFSFYPQGAISMFDFMTVLNRLIAGLVFMGLVDNVVTIVATYILPEKDTYSRAKTTTLVFQDAVAKFGINAALACTAFRLWDQGKEEVEGGTHINEQELEKVYMDQGCLAPAIAKKFSAAIMEAVEESSGKKELTCEQLVRIMSTGLVTLDGLDHHIRLSTNDGPYKVGPAPEDDISLEDTAD